MPDFKQLNTRHNLKKLLYTMIKPRYYLHNIRYRTLQCPILTNTNTPLPIIKPIFNLRHSASQCKQKKTSIMVFLTSPLESLSAGNEVSQKRKHRKRQRTDNGPFAIECMPSLHIKPMTLTKQFFIKC